MPSAGCDKEASRRRIDAPNVFLFRDDAANEEHVSVRDRWAAPDLLLYRGEGEQDSDQTLASTTEVVSHSTPHWGPPDSLICR